MEHGSVDTSTSMTEDSSDSVNTIGDQQPSAAVQPRNPTKRATRTRDLQSRLSLRHFLECRALMTPGMERVFKRTPFAHFLECTDIVQDMGTITRLVNAYRVEEKGFMIGGKIVPFLPNDVGLILGLRVDGISVKVGGKAYKKLTSQLKETYFPKDAVVTAKGKVKRPRVDRETIDQAMDKCLAVKKKSTEEDFVKLALLNLFCNFLFPESNYSVPLSLFSYVENLADLDRYAWGLAVYDFLLKSIEDVHKRKYMNGCVVVLIPWLYEHVDIIRAVDTNALPRINKWVHRRKNQGLPIDEYLPHTVSEGPLVATAVETTLGYGTRSVVHVAARAASSVAPDDGQWRLRKENHELKKIVKRLKKEVQEKETTIQMLERVNQELKAGDDAGWHHVSPVPSNTRDTALVDVENSKHEIGNFENLDSIGMGKAGDEEEEKEEVEGQVLKELEPKGEASKSIGNRRKRKGKGSSFESYIAWEDEERQKKKKEKCDEADRYKIVPRVTEMERGVNEKEKEPEHNVAKKGRKKQVIDPSSMTKRIKLRHTRSTSKLVEIAPVQVCKRKRTRVRKRNVSKNSQSEVGAAHEAMKDAGNVIENLTRALLVVEKKNEPTEQGCLEKTSEREGANSEASEVVAIDDAMIVVAEMHNEPTEVNVLEETPMKELVTITQLSEMPETLKDVEKGDNNLEMSVQEMISHFAGDFCAWEDKDDGLFLTISNIETLTTSQRYISDNVVEALIRVFENHHQNNLSAKKLFHYDPKFAECVRNGSWSSVRGFLRNCVSKIKEANYICFPICYEDHWTLLVGVMAEKCFMAYNSLQPRQHGKDEADWDEEADGDHDQQAVELAKFMKGFIGAKVHHGDDQIEHFWKVRFIRECPQQAPDSNLCGIYILRWIECLCKGGDIKTTAENDFESYRDIYARMLFSDYRCKLQL